ncbi:MAG TPA: DegT/DnrJ/EryC1/StrS family aminotransferase [Methyloradius sp.]
MTDIKIPLLIPQLPNREALWPYLGQIDEKQHYSNFGPLVKRLESSLQQRFQLHAQIPLLVTTVSSATLGLELALSALGLPKGTRVLVPALTFVATLTAVIRAGYIPVVTDIDPDSWLLTPEIATEAAKSSDAGAVLAVATFSQPQDTLLWHEFQKKTGIRVVIDAAAAFGSQWVQAPDIPVVFSMHATKSLAAGEGGFVVSGEQKNIGLVTQMSNFGINLDPLAHLPVGYLSSVGTNAKLSEYHAAVALASLDGWDLMAATRRAVAARYRQSLIAACGSALIWQTGSEVAAPTTFSVRVGSYAVRQKLEDTCVKQGIATRRWYQPLLHQHAEKIEPLLSLPAHTAEAVADDLIGLPFFAMMSDEQMTAIVNAVHSVVSS